VKICHHRFPYLWECFEIGLKTSSRGEFIFKIPSGRHTGARSREKQQPPWNAAWRGTGRTCSLAEKLLFTVVLPALESVRVLV